MSDLKAIVLREYIIREEDIPEGKNFLEVASDAQFHGTWEVGESSIECAEEVQAPILYRVEEQEKLERRIKAMLVDKYINHQATTTQEKFYIYRAVTRMTPAVRIHSDYTFTLDADEFARRYNPRPLSSMWDGQVVGKFVTAMNEDLRLIMSLFQAI